MQRYVEKVESIRLPVIILRGLIPFPSIPISFELTDEKVAAAIEGKTIVKEIAIPNRIVNIVVR